MRDANVPEVGAGLEVRRSMFGDELVDRNYTRATGFQRPIQDWIAGAVWADVWTRDGIDRRVRSLITLGMLVALNRPEELERHLGAAVANGCTVAEIQEVIVHSAPYCGAPAALSSSRLAERVLAGLGLIP